MIPLREQEFLREKFSHELVKRVRIDFFTEKESSVLVPGRQPCQYCKPTRQMLQELAALTDGISLRQHIFEEAREAVAQYRVERIPAIVLHGGEARWLKYYGIPGGYEIGVNDLQVLQLAEKYPIQPKEHGVDFLMENRHLWIRSQRQWAVLRVRATVVRAIRDWLGDNGFDLIPYVEHEIAVVVREPPCPLLKEAVKVQYCNRL